MLDPLPTDFGWPDFTRTQNVKCNIFKEIFEIFNRNPWWCSTKYTTLKSHHEFACLCECVLGEGCSCDRVIVNERQWFTMYARYWRVVVSSVHSLRRSTGAYY